MTSIRIEGVTRRFGPAIALAGVDLEILAGEVFFLLGPAGCGKTTLLRVVAGLETPDAGRVLIGGKDVTRLPSSQREAVMVFQGYALWPHMTVERNVSFGLEVRSVPRAERASRVAEALGSVHLGDLAARRPGQLSGGQQQRVALARALVVRPRVLLLDEPLSNLDASLRAEMRTEIRRLCKDLGLTALYVTHDQHEAMAAADRIAVMRDGKVAQVGSPRDLYDRPASRFVAEFMGRTNVLAARVVEVGEPAVLETPIGKLRASLVPEGTPRGSECLCSVRPEAWRIAAAGDPVAVTVISSTFMGDRTEIVAEAGGGVRLEVTDAGREPAPAAGDAIRLSVSPDDVVVLPAEAGAEGRT